MDFFHSVIYAFLSQFLLLFFSLFHGKKSEKIYWVLFFYCVLCCLTTIVSSRINLAFDLKKCLMDVWDSFSGSCSDMCQFNLQKLKENTLMWPITDFRLCNFSSQINEVEILSKNNRDFISFHAVFLINSNLISNVSNLLFFIFKRIRFIVLINPSHPNMYENVLLNY